MTEQQCAIDTQSAAMFDSLLSEYVPFGDSDYILDQLHACYRRRLDKISAVLPAAGQLVDAIDRADPYRRYRVMGDTVVRCVTQQALRQVVTQTEYGLPLETCEKVFQQTVDHLDGGKRCGPLEGTGGNVDRLGQAAWHGWIWSEEHDDDLFGQAFRQIVRRNFGESLSTPSPGELAMVRDGARLLEDILPKLSSSALRHAYVVALFSPIGNWKGKGSCSQYRISGTIFLNRELLGNPWWVAEHLFHESLHQKLYDFRHGHSLLAQDAVPRTDLRSSGSELLAVDRPRVLAPWNSPGLKGLNQWDAHRALVAFHVYVHLALFCSMAEHRAPELKETYGVPIRPPAAMTPGRTAFDRAHNLGESLLGSCRGELGQAGQLLVEWLTSILDALDPTPPPRGSIVHLLLDRYIREAKRVKNMKSYESSPDVDRQLVELAEEEVRTTRALLRAANAGTFLNDLDTSLKDLETSSKSGNYQTNSKFCEVRLVIAQTLSKSLPVIRAARVKHQGNLAPDELVGRMIEDSSRKLAESGAAG